MLGFPPSPSSTAVHHQQYIRPLLRKLIQQGLLSVRRPTMTMLNTDTGASAVFALYIASHPSLKPLAGTCCTLLLQHLRAALHGLACTQKRPKN